MGWLSLSHKHSTLVFYLIGVRCLISNSLLFFGGAFYSTFKTSKLNRLLQKQNLPSWQDPTAHTYFLRLKVWSTGRELLSCPANTFTSALTEEHSWTTAVCCVLPEASSPAAGEFDHIQLHRLYSDKTTQNCVVDQLSMINWPFKKKKILSIRAYFRFQFEAFFYISHVT